MNSDLFFSASKSVANRYLLCRIAARTVRTLHFASANTQDAITDAFVRIGNHSSEKDGQALYSKPLEVFEAAPPMPERQPRYHAGWS